MHNPSTHCNYTHSSHSYHPRSQESERFRLSVHYGCWVLMCCEWDGPWLQHHFCLLCRQDLKLWSSVKRVNKFLEATAALFFCWRVTLHERRGIIKKCEKCSKLKVEENMWKSRVVSCKKLGLQGIGGWVHGKPRFSLRLVWEIWSLVWFSSDNNSTLKVPCTWGIYNVNMQTRQES